MLNSFDRNYGMSQNSREFWGGNNGFVTLVVTLPASTEIGATAVTQDGSDTAQTALSAAQYNQFKLAQILGSRAVIVATSVLSNTVDPTAASFTAASANTLAYASTGTLAANSFGITFLIERANVLTDQTTKSGSIINVPVTPCADLCATIAQAGFFKTTTGTASATATAVAVKVVNALPVLM